MLADLHIHTSLSVDGAICPHKLVTLALSRGLAAIAVTDHDLVRGAHMVREAALGTALRVVVGCEVTTDAGHLLALGIQEDIWPKRPRPVPWRLAMREICAQGGLVVWAHPARTDLPLNDALYQEVDGIEIFNGRVRWGRYSGANKRADWVWRSGRPLLASAGSDAHCPAEVGSVALEGPDLDGPLDALALRGWLEDAHRVWAWRPSPVWQTCSQLIKAGRTRNAPLLVRAIGRAAWRLPESLALPDLRRRVVWTRSGEEP